MPTARYPWPPEPPPPVLVTPEPTLPVVGTPRHVEWPPRPAASDEEVLARTEDDVDPDGRAELQALLTELSPGQRPPDHPG